MASKRPKAAAKASGAGSAPISVRLDADIVGKLDRHIGGNRSEAIRTLVVEGLAMRAYPGIEFRSRWPGRRAAVAGGPSVCWIVQEYRLSIGSRDERIAAVSECYEISIDKVVTALTYYSENPRQIDEYLADLERFAAESQAAMQAIDEL